MKKIIYSLLALLALIGCQEDEWTGNGKKQEIRVTASLPVTRTLFTEDGSVTHVSWEKGDAIKICTKEQASLEYYAKEAGRETEFYGNGQRLQAADGDSVYACYPRRYSSDGDPYHASLYNSWQIYGEKITDYDFIYAADVVKNGQVNLQFKHLYAFLKITIPTELIPDRGENGGLWMESTEDIGGGITFDLQKGEIISTEISKHISYHIADTVQSKEATCHIAILPQSENAEIKIYQWSKNYRKDCLLTKKAPIGGFKAGNVYTLYLNENETEVARQQERDALIAFYKATNGDNWTNNENWCSDKPLSEWYGIGTDLVGQVYYLNLNGNNLTGHIPEGIGDLSGLRYLYLADNNLEGTLPESMANLTELEYLFLDANKLSGNIPSGITELACWSTCGMANVVQQSGYYFNFSTTRLKLPEFNKTDLITSAPINNVDVLKEQELTIVYIWSKDYDYYQSMLTTLYERYKDYGLQILGVHIPGSIESDLVSYIKENQMDGWHHITSDNINWIFYYPTIAVFDKNGECQYLNYYESVIGKSLGNIVKEKLGEGKPMEESEDYTADGHYKQLQQAEVGNGIDLIFMGEAFTDSDIKSGLYEQVMVNAVEQFFSIEPYKTFRNRFNAYMVNVISKNNEFREGAEHRINESDSICFVYARKIPYVKSGKWHISVIYNTNGYAGRSYTRMYGDGTFVGYMMEGVNVVLNHEVGGHGFAKLLDEYVEGGYENETLPEDDKENLDYNWQYFGWGANVDWRNDKSSVKWSRLLNDSRYAGEGLGLYEGANLYGYGCYRPTENSMMRYNDSPFNAPSREQIYKRIMQESEGEGWTYDYEEFVKYDAVNRNAATTRALQREPSKEEIEEFRKHHCPPVFIKGTWRDAVKKQKKDNIIVPLR